MRRVARCRRSDLCQRSVRSQRGTNPGDSQRNNRAGRGGEKFQKQRRQWQRQVQWQRRESPSLCPRSRGFRRRVGALARHLARFSRPSHGLSPSLGSRRQRNRHRAARPGAHRIITGAGRCGPKALRRARPLPLSEHLKQLISTEQPKEKALLVGVELPSRDHRVPLEYSLEELERLAKTAGAAVLGKCAQQIKNVTPATLIGRGKVNEIQASIKQLNADLVIVDEDLTPAQQRNLENAFKVRVVDRSQLILDIFAQRARSNEGKLQVELAQLEYLLPRLTRQWTHLSRLGGGVGTRGK